MLQTGVIPNIEPAIRVGIALPEDKINKLKLEIPQSNIFTVNSTII